MQVVYGCVRNGVRRSCATGRGEAKECSDASVLDLRAFTSGRAPASLLLFAQLILPCYVQVVFPDRASESRPAWLSWTQEEWLLHREEWYDAIDKVLHVTRVLE